MSWRLRLVGLDIEIKYKLAKVNQQADALSRHRTEAKTALHDEDENIPAFLIDQNVKEQSTNIVD